mmetsp:Transcript_1464/g.2993  ORF Transcript_1464/g.2993 Transcript_1464/m.2993 type:complete len:113 (-) Transcript_1464:1252-1590(-)
MAQTVVHIPIHIIPLQLMDWRITEPEGIKVFNTRSSTLLRFRRIFRFVRILHHDRVILVNTSLLTKNENNYPIYDTIQQQPPTGSSGSKTSDSKTAVNMSTTLVALGLSSGS